MSITGAVAELNKEIERITKIRDSLLQGAPGTAVAATTTGAAKKGKRKPGRPAKKSAAVTKSVVATKSAPAKKRTMSAEGRKRISEANKARWAAVKKAKVSK